MYDDYQHTLGVDLWSSHYQVNQAHILLIILSSLYLYFYIDKNNK